MTPRRWYSSPELNPQQRPPAVRPELTAIYLACAARVRSDQGSVIRRQPDPAPKRSAAPARSPRPPRLIEAA
jgi:hypothetical protein